MGAFFGRNKKGGFGLGYFLAATKRVAMDGDIILLQLKDGQN